MYIVNMAEGVKFEEEEFKPLMEEFVEKTGTFSRKRVLVFLAEDPIADYVCSTPCKITSSSELGAVCTNR